MEQWSNGAKVLVYSKFAESISCTWIYW